MKQIEDIIIRPFERRDVDVVTQIIAQSFDAKFAHMTDVSPDQRAALLKEAGFIQRRPFEGYFIAQCGDEVKGVMMLKWMGQARSDSRYHIPWRQLFRKYGFLNVLRLQLGTFFLREQVGAGEGYIEYIAVSPDAQGQGIGRQLIDFGEAFFGNRSGIQHYTLYVAMRNAGAIRLYERLGFQTQRTLTSAMSCAIMGVGCWHYMTKSIHNHQRPQYAMVKGWWLGFLGIMGIVNFRHILLAIDGGAWFGGLNILWFLWFLCLIPQRKS